MVTCINFTSLDFPQAPRLHGKFSKVMTHVHVNNSPFSHAEPVKPAGHTQLPYSLAKTPPFAQLTLEDADGKINCYETMNDSSDTTKITCGLGSLVPLLCPHQNKDLS
jgi:hypothetical protein